MTVIVAITRDNAIGRNGDMVYHISADLKRFKSLTMGHPILMGRRTLESFPNGPLPGRRNIVLSRNAEYHPEGAEVVHSLDEAMAIAPDAFVIGGAQIYAQAMPYADILEVTEIDAEAPDADTHFPEIDPRQWQAEEIGEWQHDARSGVQFRYVRYVRIPQTAQSEKIIKINGEKIL